MGVIPWQKDWVEITSVIKPGGSRRHFRSVSWVIRITVTWQPRCTELCSLQESWNNPLCTCLNTYYSPNKRHFSQQFKESFFSSGCQTWKTKGRKEPKKWKKEKLLMQLMIQAQQSWSKLTKHSDPGDLMRQMSESKSKVFRDGSYLGNILTAEQQPSTAISYLLLTYMGIHSHVWNFREKRGISGFAKGKEQLSFPASSNQNSYLKTKPLSSVKQAPRPKEGTGTLVTMSATTGRGFALFDALGGDSGKGDGQREKQEFHHSTKTQMKETTDNKHWKTSW